MSDLIDRQAVLNALKEHRALYCDNTPETFSKLSYAEKSRVDELDTAIATIVNLPSAENKGEWIFYDEEFYPQGRFASVNHRIRECSICHHKIADFVGDMDFCPNCGADMRGDKDDR